MVTVKSTVLGLMIMLGGQQLGDFTNRVIEYNSDPDNVYKATSSTANLVGYGGFALLGLWYMLGSRDARKKKTYNYRDMTEVQ